MLLNIRQLQKTVRQLRASCTRGASDGLAIIRLSYFVSVENPTANKSEALHLSEGAVAVAHYMSGSK